MSPFPIKLLPVLLSLLTGFGILLHDTRLNKAFEALPGSSYVNSQSTLRGSGNDHIHTETVGESLQRASAAQPLLQSRFTDEKKYLTPRRVFLNTTSDGSG